ncbi:hypothetical protein Pmani_017935 [Petrolisthes manimaculis]|uniref:Uncharacterized protein n=1 Tax=Petrolisthes manimaculis TaxID=1843537 RepID=A0AAE1PP14_9EUCA|nr:hypothetical protein Pmani_017935 [Petrolisthes manimaculis]
MRREVAAFTNTFLQAYTHDVSLLLHLHRDNLASGITKRWRRQVMVTPDMAALKGGYTRFFRGQHKQQHNTKAKKRNRGGGGVDDLPVVLVEEEDGTKCVASSHLSTFGFLGFVLNIVNAVINVANNINNNDNSNNNNNNNNNNNDLNINQAQITQSSTNTNTAMAMAGRRLQHLNQMRTSVHRNLRRLQHYNNSSRRRRKRSLMASCGGAQDDHINNKNFTLKSTSDSCCEHLLGCNGDECNNDSHASHQMSPPESCGEGKCKESSGSCGEGKCKESSESCGEGKCKESSESCGEGKCKESSESCGEGKCKESSGSCGEGKCKGSSESCGEGKCEVFSGSCGGESEGDRMVNEAVLAAAALIDMWSELVAEEDPWYMARHVCRTTAALAVTSSRLAAIMGDVGVAAAAHTLVNFQGVNPDFLMEAAEVGADGGDCELKYPASCST